MRKQANTNINSQKLNPDPLLGYKERKKEKTRERARKTKGFRIQQQKIRNPYLGFSCEEDRESKHALTTYFPPNFP